MRVPLALIGSLALIGLSLTAGLEVGRAAWGTGDWVGRFSIGGAVGFAGFALTTGFIDLLGLAAIWRPEVLSASLDRLGRRLARVRVLRWPAIAALVLLPALLTYYTPLGSLFSTPPVRLMLLVACLGLAWIVRGGLSTGGSPSAFPALAVSAGVALVLAREFSTVTGYPFSLSWSEGNRLWDYSLAFGRDRYLLPPGQETFAYISPGRQILWGLAFLVPGASILLARLWSAILFTLPYALFGWAAMRAERSADGAGWRLAFAGWSLLFLAQGPIYTPLVLSALAVAVAVRLRKSLMAAALIALASYYAYDSRWTWLLAPGAWGVLVTVLEAPLFVEGRWQVDRLRRAMLFGVAGVLGGYFAPALMAWLTQGTGPAGVANVGSSLTRQPLLWYRLLPNPTYGPGVLLALALAAGPALAVLAWLRRERLWSPDRWQRAALVALLSALLMAGIVVSAKIGGGSNLHNLDMFLITLIFTAAVVFGGEAGMGRLRLVLGQPAGRWLLAAAAAIPAALAVCTGGPLMLPEKAIVDQALQVIRSEVAAATANGDVLFYDQRQLLTFGEVQGVPLVAEYEKKYMADQALSGDPAVFEPFYEDLARQRFALIVSPPLETTWQEDHPFSEEDEAQVRLLYLPMAESYEAAVRLDPVGVWLLKPRAITAARNAP